MATERGGRRVGCFMDEERILSGFLRSLCEGLTLKLERLAVFLPPSVFYLISSPFSSREVRDSVCLTQISEMNRCEVFFLWRGEATR
ncbi:hypothetical protein AVEN_23126-1 [Araneus ventricosus]|uniref:Uncharacterized protein n=1 Tax=Araneus ventricosus TaxID=182803 RepID=A0A4Y2NVJ8_ARAVE|nr:hypothetical protein AVEN_23126-1 [Araneus ventricosus]